MTNIFTKTIEREVNSTVTENGHYALGTTNSALLDLYGLAGGLRSRDEDEVIDLFEKAYAESPVYATRLLFYIRDVREGLGERKIFRTLVKHMAKKHIQVLNQVIHMIPEYGRWDDLYALYDTDAEATACKLFECTLISDIESMSEGKPISLCSKWMKSANVRNEEAHKYAVRTAKYMGYDMKTYRQTLSKLRKYLNIVETNLSSKTYERINYGEVPSRAMMLYRNAFARNDVVRFGEYIESLQKGEAKINAGAITPYDIIHRVRTEYNSVLEEQWKALPNYVDDDTNILVMADTSDSMTCDNYRPMETALSLAMYFAERNHGAFQNIFMTFSNDPRFVKLDPELNLFWRYHSFEPIIANTDFDAAFRYILDIAVRDHIPNKDMPKQMLVISDMEFDCASDDNYRTTYEDMSEAFREKGYDLPGIIFWNVASRANRFQASSENPNCQLASGQSAAVFKSVMDALGSTPYEAMMKTLNSERYACINPNVDE